jgi:hypothetical protein
MSLSMVAGDFDIASQGLSFQFYDSDESAAVPCKVTVQVLQDLGTFHNLSFTPEEVTGVLLPELDRLASAKYRAGRLELDGGLVIRDSDLLRYGFQRPC